MASGAPGRAAGPPDTTPPPPAAAAPAQARADAPEPTASLLAVDGTGLLVRCSRGARGRTSMLAPDGTPTAALTLFAGSIARKLRIVKPSHLVVAWDGPGAAHWRRGLWPGYKENRPEWLVHGKDMQQVMEFCRDAGMHQLMQPGFEADDMLAAVTRAAAHDLPGKQVVLCSDDGDMLQLLDDDVVLTGLSFDTVIKADDVEDEYGADPCWLPEIRALAGDKSDNIPGLPMIGPKRAVRMLEKAGWIWPLPGKMIPDPDYRRLAVIWRDIMELIIPPKPPELAVGTDYFQLGDQARWDPEAAGNVRPLLDRYGMSRIAERLDKGVLW